MHVFLEKLKWQLKNENCIDTMLFYEWSMNGLAVLNIGDAGKFYLTSAFNLSLEIFL